ncbi:MAG: LuxR C-terminal-related transcriptional regulator [Methylomonas sp.]|jgi:DNA-binding CsgD family transcriptional regulator|uniref:helix-turn-helix transcriptional regulator n=1 Tax=Methylomonas sp. TaxID=418 RepID=UPI0025CD77F1|nr:LuxR C-terminal-related transcriptional regulator [Methylomonas sp.]MCK9606450.1 LuxR C-terminal-related transcriptional regulator [Methylomonas sp.]
MRQLSDDLYLHTILANAPGYPLIWNRFLNELTRQLCFDSSALLVTDLNDYGNTRFLFSAHISNEYQEQYQDKLNRLDLFNHYISKNPRRITCNQNLQYGNPSELKSAFFAPEQQNFRFGVALACSQNHALSLLLNRKHAFSHAEQQHITQLLENMLPILQDAIHKEQRHKINSQLLHHLGDHFDGYIIVDHELNILFSDPIYTAIISQLDCVHISENRFGMKNPVIEQRLLSLIEHNQESSSIHNQCQSCQISLIPIASLKNLYQWECYMDGFILTFTHEKDKNPALDRLMHLHSLSRCEAICALHFMKNPSIPDIASHTYRSQETVRNHIKHTMQKMNVHSQAELMKKLITLASL